jgi:hypothetical protein
MTSYCTLSDLKAYLIGSSASADDVLLQRMLDAATSRIDSRTGRTFYASADTTRLHDSNDVINGELQLDGDMSYLTAITNGDGASIPVTSVYTSPRRGPAYGLTILSSQPYYWTYSTDPQNAVSITGRWAYMDKWQFTSISRVTGTALVTATMNNPQYSVGQNIDVVGVADASFNGSFVVTAVTATSVTWSQAGATDSDTTGYILSAPLDIVTACRRLAAWFYRQKDTQMGDTDRPILAGDGSVIMPTTLPQDVEKMLLPFCRLVI